MHRQPGRDEAPPGAAQPDGADVERPADRGEPHTIAERILRARSRAVREHDEKAWPAPLDPSNTALVQRERRLFANVGRLPLQVFTRHANMTKAGRDGDREAHTDPVPRQMFGIGEKTLAGRAAALIVAGYA